MQSNHKSRGRIFFELLCAFGISGSFALASMETQAPALLGAAGIAAFYGLIHFFDMFRRAPTAGAEAPRPVAVARPETAPAVSVARPEPAPPVELEVAEPERPAEVSLTAPKPKKKRAARSKSGAGKASAAPALATVEPERQPEHPPIAPLFEPEPFVRQQQRAAFGRKLSVR